MRNKIQLLFILLSIIIISFPSICFSKSKTVTGEYCDVYLGDMKNKKELEEFRQTVKTGSIKNGLHKHTDPLKLFPTDECFSYVISNYLEKIVVVSRTEKGRKICDKVKITLDSEVINKYLSQKTCDVRMSTEDFLYQLSPHKEIDDVLTKKTDKINIGLIIETKITDSDGNKRELLENEEEKQFFDMIERNKDKYKVVDRRHLKNILEEQKLSSSGITDSETVKLGKILNLDIIVLRILYDKSQVTKVLKVDTGEVLLFKTYKTETEEGWVYYGESQNGKFYYDKKNITNVSPNVVRVWEKTVVSKSMKDEYIQVRKKYYKRIGGWDKWEHDITLHEVDCKNNTIKTIKMVQYNTKGELLEETEFQEPSVQQIIPESINESLRAKVCPK